jgi:hypothetical protein
LQLKAVVSTVFDLPLLKPYAATLQPLRAFAEGKPVLVLGALLGLLLVPLTLLIMRGAGRAKVRVCVCVRACVWGGGDTTGGSAA